jgi:hypothetical protein
LTFFGLFQILKFVAEPSVEGHRELTTAVRRMQGEMTIFHVYLDKCSIIYKYLKDFG